MFGAFYIPVMEIHKTVVCIGRQTVINIILAFCVPQSSSSPKSHGHGGLQYQALCFQAKDKTLYVCG